MSKLEAFDIGVLGAAVVYVLTYRDTRIAAFLEDPRWNWTVFVWDVVLSCCVAVS